MDGAHSKPFLAHATHKGRCQCPRSRSRIQEPHRRRQRAKKQSHEITHRRGREELPERFLSLPAFLRNRKCGWRCYHVAHDAVTGWVLSTYLVSSSNGLSNLGKPIATRQKKVAGRQTKNPANFRGVIMSEAHPPFFVCVPFLDVLPGGRSDWRTSSAHVKVTAWAVEEGASPFPNSLQESPPLATVPVNT